MICPKCGTAIQDGYMYCPKCGEEVIMVPDFEVELEAGIEETISEVAEMMADSVDGDVDIDKASGSTGKFKNKFSLKIKLAVACALVLGLLLVFVTVRIVSIVRTYYSFEQQSAKLEDEFANGDYEQAVKTARHVMSLNPEDQRSRLVLADSYYALEKYDESIAILTSLLEEYPTDISIYERLLNNYENEGDVKSILNLSDKAGLDSIKLLFSDYVSNSPQFSQESGNYTGPMELELKADDKGSIYYTVDGSQPTEKSLLYKTPIKLEEGETTVTAIHVNDKGVSSDSISKTYNVKIAAPEIPKLLTQPGDYSIPKLIKLEEALGGTIYYTTNGKDPTPDSREYEPPLPMPLGKTEFRFAIINDSGEVGEVVVAEYNLKISGIDEAYAANLVQVKLLSLGHDVTGHEFVARYGYSQETRSYYIIEDYANKIKQNTVYAVDAQTGEVFTITRNVKTGDYDFGVVQ